MRSGRDNRGTAPADGGAAALSPTESLFDDRGGR